MSSSANRRPRVAGHRRRPATPTTSPDLTPAGTPTETATETEAEPQTEVEPQTEAEPEAQTQAGTSPEPEVRDAPTRRHLLVPSLALILSLALLAAVLLVTRADPGERARSASAATATARSTLEQILSYNHATMAQQLPASQALLTGSFRGEFAETMTRTIVPLAVKDKTVVRARVHEVGVVSQTDGSVTVQAFVNQARTSDVQKEPSIDQNRVIATMRRVEGRWLVSGLKAY